ncbi:hypothetical protein [Streptomyces sp. S1]|uniref:hypothetical protein n=1 Tax=Streptomyces sp. S1 TaxID=718288 RepID=UPI003D71676F
MRANAPGKLSLAGAYAWGYAALGYAQREGTDPAWHQETDPLDVLFLGMTWPRPFRDEFEFANARDAWLRLLRGTVHGKGVEAFVREAVSTSEDLGLPLDDGGLMQVLTGRLEAVGLNQRRLPRRLLPEVALQGSRAVCGPSLELKFPRPPQDAEMRIQRFWAATGTELRADHTPEAVLREGLRRFQSTGLPVEEEPGLLLPALYASLLAKPGELLENMGAHAWAWAASLDEASPLMPLLDVLLVAPEVGMSVTETLGHAFAVPAFTEPFPSDSLLWNSSPGLALPRLAFELGIPEVAVGGRTIHPDELDWWGMQSRMHLSATARGDDFDSGSEPDLEEHDEYEGFEESGRTGSLPEEPAAQWAERREDVREAVRKKLRKKSGGAAATPPPPSSAGERIWNADGSSLIRISTGTPLGQELKEGLESQLDFFREKFGREPGPGDPLFFDPDADEPTRLTKKYFDDTLLRMAEYAEEEGLDTALFHAWREVGYVVTEETRSGFTYAEVITFNRALARHEEEG